MRFVFAALISAGLAACASLASAPAPDRVNVQSADERTHAVYRLFQQLPGSTECVPIYQGGAGFSDVTKTVRNLARYGIEPDVVIIARWNVDISRIYEGCRGDMTRGSRL